MSSFKLIENIDSDLWERCVKNSDQGSIYLTLNFIKSLGIEYTTYLVIKGEEPQGGCVVLKDEGGNIFKSPYHFVLSQGFFFNGVKSTDNKIIKTQYEVTDFLVNALIARYGKLSQSHYRINDLRPFQWYNYHTPEKGIFTISIYYTSILSLDKYKSLEDYLMAIRTVRRQEFRKVKAKDIKIIDSSDTNILCDLHRKTFERQGIKLPEHEMTLVESIAKTAVENKYGRINIALMNNIPISATLLLFDDKRAYYQFGATDPDYRDTFASTLLMIENIWRAKTEGFKEFDFVGVNSPNRGDYKLSFDGVLLPCYGTHYNI